MFSSPKLMLREMFRVPTLTPELKKLAAFVMDESASSDGRGQLTHTLTPRSSLPVPPIRTAPALAICRTGSVQQLPGETRSHHVQPNRAGRSGSEEDAHGSEIAADAHVYGTLRRNALYGWVLSKIG